LKEARTSAADALKRYESGTESLASEVQELEMQLEAVNADLRIEREQARPADRDAALASDLRMEEHEQQRRSEIRTVEANAQLLQEKVMSEKGHFEFLESRDQVLRLEFAQERARAEEQLATEANDCRRFVLLEEALQSELRVLRSELETHGQHFAREKADLLQLFEGENEAQERPLGSEEAEAVASSRLDFAELQHRFMEEECACRDHKMASDEMLGQLRLEVRHWNRIGEERLEQTRTLESEYEKARTTLIEIKLAEEQTARVCQRFDAQQRELREELAAACASDKSGASAKQLWKEREAGAQASRTNAKISGRANGADADTPPTTLPANNRPAAIPPRNLGRSFSAMNVGDPAGKKRFAAIPNEAVDDASAVPASPQGAPERPAMLPTSLNAEASPAPAPPDVQEAVSVPSPDLAGPVSDNKQLENNTGGNDAQANGGSHDDGMQRIDLVTTFGVANGHRVVERHRHAHVDSDDSDTDQDSQTAAPHAVRRGSNPSMWPGSSTGANRTPSGSPNSSSRALPTPNATPLPSGSRSLLVANEQLSPASLSSPKPSPKPSPKVSPNSSAKSSPTK